MSLRSPLYGVLLICLVSSLTACEADHSTEPTALSSTIVGPSSLGNPVFAVQPATLRPEFINGTSCMTFLPFNTRVVIVPGNGLVVSGVGFRFTDTFGVVVVPRVSSGQSGFPIPMPGSLPPLPTPTPIPGSSSSTQQQLTFLLTFDCGVRPQGMLMIDVQGAAPGGMMQTSQMQVRLTP
jgi:hypothetical protein